MTDKNLDAICFLIIDDNPAIVKIIGWLAQSIGVGEVHCALSANEGFRQILDLKPDIVFVDIDMPQSNGYAFIEFVRSQADARLRRTPIVMIAGSDGDKSAEHSIYKGANAFVTKPVSAGTMRTYMEKCLFHPRRFIETESYVGPDRRTGHRATYEGVDCRKIQDDIVKNNVYARL